MFGANGLIAYNDGSHGTLFYAFDERGNVAQRVDASGNVASSDLYDAYGQKLAGNPSGDPYGFSAQAGYRTDAETGLCLLTYRYYDPAAGRFVTRDPAGYGGGINLYSYTQNNPTNEIDPMGTATFGFGTFTDTEGLPIGTIFGIPVTLGAGGGFSVSIDTHGTLSLGGSGQGQIGFGAAAETGDYMSVSPGFNTAPGLSGVGGSAYLYGGAGYERGKNGTAVEGQATAPILYLYPFSSPSNTSHNPTISGSRGIGTGAAGFVTLGISGSLNLNLPSLWNRVKHAWGRAFSGPIGDFPPPDASPSHTAIGKMCE